MLKNVLEANGYVWYFDFGKETTRYAVLKKDGVEVFRYAFADLGTLETKEYLRQLDLVYEQGSKQYVRENGFKLSWLDFGKYRLLLHMWFSLEEKTLLNLLILMFGKNVHWNNETYKLIAWLYSEDIKIVEGE